MPKIVSFKNKKEKEILKSNLKTGQYPTAYAKEEKGLLRQKAEHFTLLGDDICFKRRDHLIKAVFGFETALIKQIIQTEHAVAHIGVNKMMALIAQKYYGIPKEYVKEYEKRVKHVVDSIL
ncbi:Protein spt10 [Hamiltosporidium tvaerminnensis]|nr:Protein spt10 [Hamiltosporidium tvaerminnensis]